MSSKTVQGCFDLIVLDPQIKGLDGLQLLKLIRAADQTLRVIVVTGKQETREAAEVLKDGGLRIRPQAVRFHTARASCRARALGRYQPRFGVTNAFSTV